MEEMNQLKLSLSLPVIELPEGKKAWNCNSYEESGMYFVKDSIGAYHFVEVQLKEQNVIDFLFPPKICNYLQEQEFFYSMKDLVKELNDVVENSRDGILERIDYLGAQMQSNIIELVEREDRVKELNGVVENSRDGILERIDCLGAQMQSRIIELVEHEDRIKEDLTHIHDESRDQILHMIDEKAVDKDFLKAQLSTGFISENALVEIVKNVRK